MHRSIFARFERPQVLDLLLVVRLELLLQLLKVAQIDSNRLFANHVSRVLL